MPGEAQLKKPERVPVPSPARATWARQRLRSDAIRAAKPQNNPGNRIGYCSVDDVDDVDNLDSTDKADI